MPDGCLMPRSDVYQQKDHYVVMWANRQTTAQEVREFVLSSSLQNPAAFDVTVATPQLSDDVVTVCVTPTWWRDTQRLGVVIDHLEFGGRPFLGVVPETCSLTNVHMAYGSMVPQGLRFYLQNESDPL